MKIKNDEGHYVDTDKMNDLSAQLLEMTKNLSDFCIKNNVSHFLQVRDNALDKNQIFFAIQAEGEIFDLVQSLNYILESHVGDLFKVVLTKK